jgi:hypothetical protein
MFHTRAYSRDDLLLSFPQDKPCFNCGSTFLQNPSGLIIVFLCLFFLFYTATAACGNYWRFSKTASDVIHDSQFAQSLTSGRSGRTKILQNFCHRLRHDYACGGIFCFYALRGDPFGEPDSLFHVSDVI